MESPFVTPFNESVYLPGFNDTIDNDLFSSNSNPSEKALNSKLVLNPPIPDRLNLPIPDCELEATTNCKDVFDFVSKLNSNLLLFFSIRNLLYLALSDSEIVAVVIKPGGVVYVVNIVIK